jgi:hypothetical protein
MVGAVTNILAYWAIGIPISTVLGIQQGCAAAALPLLCVVAVPLTRVGAGTGS